MTDVRSFLILSGMVTLAGVTRVPAQERQADTLRVPAAGACWRFAFGAWTPPLDWSKAGHGGQISAQADRVRRIRDSVFAKDTSAANSNAMVWLRTSRGVELVLFPPWWPVGVEVVFDRTLAGGREMTGDAVAMVADAGQPASWTRVRAIRCESG